jgi:hypothetical protein
VVTNSFTCEAWGTVLPFQQTLEKGPVSRMPQFKFLYL